VVTGAAGGRGRTVRAARLAAAALLAGAAGPAADGTPALDAEVLLRHVLGLSRSALYTHPERRLSADEGRRFDALLAQRAGGEPVAYLTGEREFMGLTFAVDRRVLIPRPDTEALVERALVLLGALATGDTPEDAGAPARPARPLRVVDVGTGSGAIAVAVAAGAPAGAALRVVAVDRSAAALDVARGNARRLLGPAPGAGGGRSGTVDFLQASLLTALRGPFDLVLANLPYVPTGDVPRLAPAVAGYEPHLALDGGPDGLDRYRDLLRDLQAKLAPRAGVLLECDPRQAGPLRALLAAHLPGAATGVWPDLAGRARVVEAVLALPQGGFHVVTKDSGPPARSP
jgi:release factor glutamine methyltransferase